jgi:ComF family protein
MGSVYQLYRLQWNLVDLIFPPRCAGCERVGFRWCPDCEASIDRINLSCKVCGQPAREAGRICLTCAHNLPDYDAARALGIHRKSLRNAVHRLKYHNDLGLADCFAATLAAIVTENDWRPDLVIPVALSKGRERERGFNQAAVLAQPLAWQLNIPLKREGLRRTRETHTQVGLTAVERKDNVQNAFRAHGKTILEKRVLLLDDVLTSGATMNAASQALRAGGASHVFALTLSRAAFDAPA